ncbi:MAG TPA: CehA/McbA family metallohydrolase [Candidatus Udaeobacter sp.]|nr:CehA/McbA family metallohydrolase [Candidatus Udaeobacter sp.]
MTAAELSRPSLTLTGRFEKDHERRYAHVPFAVPSGLRQIHIRYAYSDQIDSDPLVGGGNTLDIGLFDERGIAEGSPGFRGWSGSNKMEFTVDEVWATPPYRSGKIGAGTWHVLLGPYKVGPRGCDWKVEIWFDPGLPTPRLFHAGVGHNPSLPAKRAGWLRGDLHCHTLFSDGDSWPPEMLEAASAAGLDFLGVTDHNNVAHHAAYGPGGRGGEPLVIPGVEVTTYGGHWNAWGTDRWWEFRDPESSAVERTMRAAMASGAVVSICHPKPFGPPWEYSNEGGFDAIEVWNGPWAQLNSASLAHWDGLLRRGVRCAAVGGSDTHYLRRRDVAARHQDSIGTPTTWVEAEATVGSILAALRDGRSFVSESPRGPQIYLDADPARIGRISIEVRDAENARVEVITAAGRIASRPAADDSLVFDVPGDARFVRAQLVAENGDLRALTNPLWMERP